MADLDKAVRTDYGRDPYCVASDSSSPRGYSLQRKRHSSGNYLAFLANDVRNSFPKNRPQREARNDPLLKIRAQLGILFRAAYKGTISIDRFYDEALGARGALNAKALRALSYRKNADLRNAFNFVDQLSDSRTRSYTQRHREEIYHQMRVICG
jgi:hypothetical protein